MDETDVIAILEVLMTPLGITVSGDRAKVLNRVQEKLDQEPPGSGCARMLQALVKYFEAEVPQGAHVTLSYYCAVTFSVPPAGPRETGI